MEIEKKIMNGTRKAKKKLLEKHEKNVKSCIQDLKKVSKQRLIQAPNFGPTSEFECTSQSGP